MLIDINKTSFKKFASLLNQNYSLEAKKIIYEYYLIELKNTNLKLDTNEIYKYWIEYKTIKDFEKDGFFTTHLNFTDDFMQELENNNLIGWRTNTKNTLVIFYC